MSMVTPPDMETWLCSYLRERIDDISGLQFDNQRATDYDGSYPLVVIRDDGGSQSERITFDRSVGVTVTGWTRTNDAPCKTLARRVYALLTDPDTIPFADGSPVVSIEETGCNGPYPVTDDQPCACYYLTVEYTAVGDF